MKLLKSGMIGLWSKAKLIFSFILRNCKLELLIVVAGIMWANLSSRVPQAHQLLVDYFDESRCSGILGYASVVIGIYVTVWSVFATSASKINEKLLRDKVEGQLFFLIGVDLIEAFITSALCAFVPAKALLYFPEVLALLTVITTVSFVKFVVLIMMITKLNINYIVQEIDEQNAKCTEVQAKLDEVYQRTINRE